MVKGYRPAVFLAATLSALLVLSPAHSFASDAHSSSLDFLGPAVARNAGTGEGFSVLPTPVEGNTVDQVRRSTPADMNNSRENLSLVTFLLALPKEIPRQIKT